MTSGSVDVERILIQCSGPMDSAIVSSILESMSDSLVVLGEEGDILYANRATEEILGFSMQDFREQGLVDIIFQMEGNFDFKHIFLDALKHKSVKNYRETDYQHPDGSLRRLAVTTSYLLDQGEPEARFIGFVALFKDITEVFKLRQREKALVAEKERISQEKIRSLHRLAMGVAHEIRNPLVTIGGFAARISRDQENSEKTRQQAKTILEDARRLEQVVNRVQELCDMPKASPKRGRLSNVAEAVIAEMALIAEQFKVRLSLRNEVPDDREMVFDTSLIAKAIHGLISNAIEFGGKGGTVDVRLRCSDEHAIIEVQDHGEGIPTADLEFIFNPFFSSKVHGPGMGLAMVERVVHEHMGRMEVESAEGNGTTMRIILPQRLDLKA